MSLRILLVEDQGESRRALTGLLHKWGFDVSGADSLQSGLAFVRAKRFDAIVSDIGLPDGTGHALIAEAKRHQENLKGIAISGFDSPEDVRLGKIAGFDYHLPKPFDCRSLHTILTQLAA